MSNASGRPMPVVNSFSVQPTSMGTDAESGEACGSNGCCATIRPSITGYQPGRSDMLRKLMTPVRRGGRRIFTPAASRSTMGIVMQLLDGGLVQAKLLEQRGRGGAGHVFFSDAKG